MAANKDNNYISPEGRASMLALVKDWTPCSRRFIVEKMGTLAAVESKWDLTLDQIDRLLAELLEGSFITDNGDVLLVTDKGWEVDDA